MDLILHTEQLVFREKLAVSSLSHNSNTMVRQLSRNFLLFGNLFYILCTRLVK